jgi:hypothetical protein
MEKDSLPPFLIQEIFKHNKKFLYSQTVQKTLKQVAKLAEETSLNSPKKGVFMKILRVFVKYKNNIIQNNQNDIVVVLTSPDKSNFLNLFKTSEGHEEVQKYIKSMINNVRGGSSDSTQDIDFPTEIHNLICSLELFSKCCEGKNSITEGKCHQNVLNLRNLHNLVKVSEICWPFKESLVNYLIQSFLNTAKDDLFDEKENFNAMWDIIKLLIDEIQYVTNTTNPNNDD